MQYGVPFPRFSEVSEDKLNALIQKAIPGKTEIARKYVIRNFKVRTKLT